MMIMNETLTNCSLIIPVFNEEENIATHLKEIVELGLFEEIIVVNDGSTDKTKDKIEQFDNVILINNHFNFGNGASVRKGILRATKSYVAIMDADGQHPPSALKELIDYTMMNDYDLVVASRRGNRKVSTYRTIGNRLLEWFASYLVNERIEDLTSGFRVFKRSSVMKVIHLFPKRYSYPSTSLLALVSLGYNVGYFKVPSIISRMRGKSGIKPVKDFYRFVKIMLRLAIVFGPAKVFLPISLFLFLLGLVDVIITLYLHRNIQELGVLSMLLSFIIASFAILGEQVTKIRIEIGEIVANEMRELKKD